MGAVQRHTLLTAFQKKWLLSLVYRMYDRRFNEVPLPSVPSHFAEAYGKKREIGATKLEWQLGPRWNTMRALSHSFKSDST